MSASRTEMSPAARPIAAPGTVQVWSDLLCPFAHVAIHRLWEARQRLGLADRVRLDHRVFPLELFNGPHPRRGTDTEAVGIGQVAPEAGFRVWGAADDLYPHTVLLAAEAVLAAKEQSLLASEHLDRGLRTAFWTESRSISHRSVVLDVAEKVGRDAGLDAERLAVALDDGRFRRALMADFAVSRGDVVSGSPHLFLPDGTDVNNPGMTVHWEGPWASGYPVVDSDDPSVYDDIVRRAAA